MSKVFGSNAIAAFSRAAHRARQVLKPGDRVTLGSKCGGGLQTVTFSHWGFLETPEPDCDYFSARTIDELHPWNITKVNGRAVSFCDDRGQTEVGADRARFHAESIQCKRSMIRLIEKQAQ